MSGISTKIDLVKQFLDMRVAEHSLHAGNIANSETPFYKARVASFENTLKTVEGSPDKKWELGMRVDTSRETPREDGNNVRMEKEMAAMSENSLMYMTALKIFNKETAIERYAITSGGR